MHCRLPLTCLFQLFASFWQRLQLFQSSRKHLAVCVCTNLGCWWTMASRKRVKSGTFLTIDPATVCTVGCPSLVFFSFLQVFGSVCSFSKVHANVWLPEYTLTWGVAEPWHQEKEPSQAHFWPWVLPQCALSAAPNCLDSHQSSLAPGLQRASALPPHRRSLGFSRNPQDLCLWQAISAAKH